KKKVGGFPFFFKKASVGDEDTDPKEVEEIFEGLDLNDRKLLEAHVREMLQAALRERRRMAILDEKKQPPLFFMTFEFLHKDLDRLLRDNAVTFSETMIKYIFEQMMEGVAHCHRCGIIHRDIKPSNVLINYTGEVKLCDFGLGYQHYSSHSTHVKTNRVVTMWYRSPELLLGAVKYYYSIDIWSMACVFMEMFLRDLPPFYGNKELEQFESIVDVLGLPATIPQLTCLPWYQDFANHCH
ncbi:cyclin-dependent kinase 12, partial [Reticulomyxa filosa]